MKNFYVKQTSESISEAIAQLPRAEEVKLFANEEEVKKFKGIEVIDNQGNREIIHCPKKRYYLVQHSEAFKPIIEGLTLAGNFDYSFSLFGNMKKAEMWIYSSGKGYDSVSLGFNVINSYDGSTSLKYGFDMSREKKWIEIVGYRQVCSNGMKIRVPLDNAEIIRPEIRKDVEKILSEKTSIRHTAKAEERIKAMQYVTEALSLLREPVENMIKLSQRWEISDTEKLKELVKIHVGKRFSKKVIQSYEDEQGDDLWDLYNAITYVASHDEKMKLSARDKLQEKGAEMLLIELKSGGDKNES